MTNLETVIQKSEKSKTQMKKTHILVFSFQHSIELGQLSHYIIIKGHLIL